MFTSAFCNILGWSRTFPSLLEHYSFHGKNRHFELATVSMHDATNTSSITSKENDTAGLLDKMCLKYFLSKISKYYHMEKKNEIIKFVVFFACTTCLDARL